MYITINNTRIFFDTYGSKLSVNKNDVTEKPTLIVLHGGHGFLDHTLYVEFWSQFADISQVVFLDQRGCGRSEHGSNNEWNLQQWADDLCQFCYILNINNPIIAGVSMGGHVMCELISRHSDLPRKLIFCNTEAKFSLELVCKKLQGLGGDKPAQACFDFYNNPTESTYTNFMKLCIPYYAKNPYSKTEIERCIKNPNVFLHYCRQQMLKFNYLDELHKIHCPTLLLVGRNSLHVVESAEEMAKNINPTFLQMKIFENTGGPVYKDQPAEAYATIKQFLLEKYN